MNHRVFAMDTYFYHSIGAYDWDARCEMLAELGYNATYLTLWNDAAWADLSRLPQVKPRFGLEVAAVYCTLDVAGDENHPGNRRILTLIETLEGCDHIEMALSTTHNALRHPAPAGTARARQWIEKVLEAAKWRRLTVSLYPHINFWLDRIEIACALCREFNHPSLRTVFCGFHWFAADGKNIRDRLAEAAPFLRSVNLCGSRRNLPGSPMPATIEPLDEGELDNFAILALLQQIGYRGMIGFQGYSIGGDVYSFLKRSLAAFRDIERRLAAHPHWANLRWT